MRHQVVFTGFSIALMVTGFAVAGAFFDLIPGYATLYLIALALALVVAFFAFRRAYDPVSRGLAGAMLSASAVYWSLAAVELPPKMIGAALVLTPITVATALFLLWKRS